MYWYNIWYYIIDTWDFDMKTSQNDIIISEIWKIELSQVDFIFDWSIKDVEGEWLSVLNQDMTCLRQNWRSICCSYQGPHHRSPGQDIPDFYQSSSSQSSQSFPWQKLSWPKSVFPVLWRTTLTFSFDFSVRSGLILKITIMISVVRNSHIADVSSLMP